MSNDWIQKIKSDKKLNDIISNLSLDQKTLDNNQYLIEEVYLERKTNKNSKWIPIIILGSDKLLYKSYILSPKGLKQKYQENIKTQEVTKVNINIKMSEIDKSIERKNLLILLKTITLKYKSAEKGLYIYGEQGRGKTFITQALANWLANKNCTIGFINTIDLISYFKANFGTNKIDNMINTLKTVDFLFVDDIGAESISEWFRDGIFLSILSSRMNNKMPTFYSSNYDLEKLLKIQTASNQKIYFSQDKAKRLIARIRATSENIKLNGKNYRY